MHIPSMYFVLPSFQVFLLLHHSSVSLHKPPLSFTSTGRHLSPTSGRTSASPCTVWIWGPVIWWRSRRNLRRASHLGDPRETMTVIGTTSPFSQRIKLVLVSLRLQLLRASQSVRPLVNWESALIYSSVVGLIPRLLTLWGCSSNHSCDQRCIPKTEGAGTRSFNARDTKSLVHETVWRIVSSPGFNKTMKNNW